jgi:DNA repair protein RAD5
MGKTIMLSALIQTNRAVDASEDPGSRTDKPKQLRLNSAFQPFESSRSSSSARGPASTLIVAPTSLLNQWADELERSSEKGTLNILVWHGTNRLELEEVAGKNSEKAITVVITSYGVLASEHSRLEKYGSQIYESRCQFLINAQNETLTLDSRLAPGCSG